LSSMGRFTNENGGALAAAAGLYQG
jgi:hypothetical protein